MIAPPPDSPAAWLERARSDLALARLALGAPGVLPADACFHAQQCAEKALKALLVHLGVPFPRTHVLELLVDLVAADTSEPGMPLSADAIVRLTQYAVETRYPGAWEPVDDAEARTAVEHASRILDWVETQIATPGEESAAAE